MAISLFTKILAGAFVFREFFQFAGTKSVVGFDALFQISDEDMLACNIKAIESDYFHIMEGNVPTQALWTQNIALLGKHLLWEGKVGSQIQFMDEKLQIVGSVGYEGLYSKTDYMIIVPIDFYFRKLDNNVLKIVIDGTAREIEAIKVRIDECYGESCSIQPVKAVGVREVYHTYDQSTFVTEGMLTFVMLFALFEHILYLFESGRKSILPFVEMGYSIGSIAGYIIRKTLIRKTIGLLAGILISSIVLQTHWIAGIFIGGIVIIEMVLGTLLTLKIIISNIQRGNDG